MGLRIKRVPLGFDWPMEEVWWGYILDGVPCQTCDGSGKMPQPITEGFLTKDGDWHIYQSEYCPTCAGESEVSPTIEVPTGPGYQLWETTSAGSPISPVFASPEELARWLLDNKTSVFMGITLPYEKWLDFIICNRWAPFAVINDRGMISGVEAIINNDIG